MQRACRWCVILILLLSSNSSAQEIGAQDFADGVPEVIERVPQAVSLPADGTRLQPLSNYAWISAEAVDRMGLDVLFKPTADLVRKGLATKDGAGCVDLYEATVFPQEGMTLADFNEMAVDSKTILEGTVRGYRPGFLRQNPTPGFMLSVEIDSLLAHDDASPSPSGRVLVFYPGPGVFTMLDRPICVQGTKLPRVPAVGDKVMIFSGRVPLDPSKGPVALYEENVIVERGDAQGIELSSKLRGDEALSKAQSMDDVRLEVLKRRSNR